MGVDEGDNAAADRSPGPAVGAVISGAFRPCSAGAFDGVFAQRWNCPSAVSSPAINSIHRTPVSAARRLAARPLVVRSVGLLVSRRSVLGDSVIRLATSLINLRLCPW